MNDPIAKPVAEAATPASLDALIGFDLPAARRNLSGDDDLLRRLLAKFARGQAAFMPSFRAALAAGDRVTAQRLAHTLASTAETLGVLAVPVPARALEHACAAGADEAALEPLLERTGAALAPVLASLQPIVAGMPAAPARAKAR